MKWKNKDGFCHVRFSRRWSLCFRWLHRLAPLEIYRDHCGKGRTIVAIGGPLFLTVTKWPLVTERIINDT